MKKKYTLFMICLISSPFFACRQNREPIREIKDEILTVQVKKIDNREQDQHLQAFAVRLSPGKDAASTLNAQAKTALWYGMDSCFYVVDRGKKVYSTIVQPIANGVTDNFEYMLSFEITDLKAGNWNLIYADKYISHKKYIIDLSKD